MYVYNATAEQLSEVALAIGFPTELLGGLELICVMGGAVRLDTSLAELTWMEGKLYVAAASQEVQDYLDYLLGS